MNEVCDEVDFLHADKHQRFLQVDSNIFGGCGQPYVNSQFNCRILRKAIRQKGLMEMAVLMPILLANQIA